MTFNNQFCVSSCKVAEHLLHYDVSVWHTPVTILSETHYQAVYGPKPQVYTLNW